MWVKMTNEVTLWSKVGRAVDDRKTVRWESGEQAVEGAPAELMELVGWYAQQGWRKQGMESLWTQQSW